jgi:hypothetical protein
MPKVYKYPFTLDAMLGIDLPVHSQALHGGPQNGSFKLWVLVSDEEETELRTFIIAMTGEPINYDLKELLFINTGFSNSIVYHVFEIVE